jgi:3-oxoacyl-[acyl-carrier protein] reductase
MSLSMRAPLLLIAAFAWQAGEEGGAIVAFASDHTTGNFPTVLRRALSRRILANVNPDQSTPDG